MKKRFIGVAIVIIIFVAGLIGIYYIFKDQTNKNDSVKDHEKFAEEYQSLPLDNLFVYKTESEIIDILRNGTGIVYLGFSECPWCCKYVSMLNEVAKELEMEEIYYYNIKEARSNNTAGYQEIVEILNKYLLTDDEGKKRIYVPDVTFVVDGKILFHDNETSVVEQGITVEGYWTDDAKLNFKNKLYNAISSTFLGQCTSCNWKRVFLTLFYMPYNVLS